MPLSFVPDCLASRPTYLYSVGSSLMLANVVIDAEKSDVIRAWPRVVLSGRGRVQSLATHVDRALVYFGDTNTGAVYRTKRNEWNAIELTVQQPHVEGKLAICSAKNQQKGPLKSTRYIITIGLTLKLRTNFRQIWHVALILTA